MSGEFDACDKLTHFKQGHRIDVNMVVDAILELRRNYENHYHEDVSYRDPNSGFRCGDHYIHYILYKNRDEGNESDDDKGPGEGKPIC